MKFSELTNQIARLESVNDQLTSEISYVDDLLQVVGFEEGLKSLKSAAAEVLDLSHDNISDLISNYLGSY